ncbi:MAG: EamA family transporter [bacterium]|nr:EamA family transporter [bacterium]
MSSSPSRLTVVATLALLVAIWGTTWSVIRVSLDGFPPLTGVAVRFAIAAAVLWGLARVRGISLWQRDHVWLWLLQAVLAFSLTYGLVYWAEQWVPSGLVSVLFSTFPLFVVLIGYTILPGERLAAWGILGVLMGFAGVAVIFSDDVGGLAGPQARQAAAVVLLAPVGAAIAHVTVKRYAQGVHPLALTAPPMAITGVLLGTVALVLESDRPIVLDTAPVLATLYLALAGSAVTFSLYYWVLKHVTAIQMSLITYAIPVVAVTIGTVFMDEPLTWRMLAGSALVILGVGFAARPRAQS